MKRTFEELKIAKSILKSLNDIGFVEPTPIQLQAIPKINSGVNIVGVAVFFSLNFISPFFQILIFESVRIPK